MESVHERFSVPESVAVRVPLGQLQAQTQAIFRACGLTAADAATATSVVMYADERGIDSHGVSNKLRDYVSKYRSGVLNARPDIRVVREGPSTAVLDGDRGIGLVVATRAMQMAMDKAAAVGVGLVAVRNAGHVGAAGYYVRMAAAQDMIGVCMAVSAARKKMVPTFGAEPRLGTNPIAFAAPARSEAPFVFDAAMTTIAGNKIGIARRIGSAMAPGWVAHGDGTPDMVGGPLEDGPPPNQLPLGSTRELGSHKGYGLAVMVEILCGQLSFAAGFGSLDPKRGGHFVAAFDVAAFGDVEEFKANMDGMLAGLRSTPAMPGQDRVYYAGLPEAETAADRRRDGVPLHPEVVEWFRSACTELNVSFALTASAGRSAR